MDVEESTSGLYTWDDLLEKLQLSEKEPQEGLKSLAAVQVGGIWRLVDKKYMHCVFKLLCSAAKTGSIIGKGGSIIKSIGQDTGAMIRIEDAVFGCDERMVIISMKDDVSLPQKSQETGGTEQSVELGMAGRLIIGMQLDALLSHILHARGILTAKDVLCKPETELMELLDLPLSRIRDVIFQTSIDACPPYRSALALKEERESEEGFGHLWTQLVDIDSALLGGIPFGAITEVVGPAGFEKTQLCLMLCVNAALQNEYGGLDGSVIYYDSEHKFHPGRMCRKWSQIMVLIL